MCFRCWPKARNESRNGQPKSDFLVSNSNLFWNLFRTFFPARPPLQHTRQKNSAGIALKKRRLTTGNLDFESLESECSRFQLKSKGKSLNWKRDARRAQAPANGLCIYKQNLLKDDIQYEHPGQRAGSWRDAPNRQSLTCTLSGDRRTACTKHTNRLKLSKGKKRILVCSLSIHRSESVPLLQRLRPLLSRLLTQETSIRRAWAASLRTITAGPAYAQVLSKFS